MTHAFENLNWWELEQVTEFLLHHMPMETRRKLAGTMPVHYSKLFPNVDRAALTAMVSEALNAAPKR